MKITTVAPTMTSKRTNHKGEAKNMRLDFNITAGPCMMGRMSLFCSSSNLLISEVVPVPFSMLRVKRWVRMVRYCWVLVS